MFHGNIVFLYHSAFVMTAYSTAVLAKVICGKEKVSKTAVID
jgi:hypothetical protein